MNEADIPFIRDSWVDKYARMSVVRRWSQTSGHGRPKFYAHEPHAAVMDQEVYSRGQRDLIGALLIHWPCIVAVPEDDDYDIIGYACGAGNVVHWIGVRPGYREGGLGTHLWDVVTKGNDKVYATHCPGKWPSFAKRAIFNPYALFWKPPTQELDTHD